MKTKLVAIVLAFLLFSILNASEILEVDKNQIKELMKKDTLYVIGVDEKIKWNKNSVKVKSFHSIGKSILELKFVKINLSKYKKDTPFIIYSKKDANAIKFVKEIKALGFKNVKYLKDGNKSWNEILQSFRGLRLFSMFSK